MTDIVQLHPENVRLDQEVARLDGRIDGVTGPNGDLAELAERTTVVEAALPEKADKAELTEETEARMGDVSGLQDNIVEASQILSGAIDVASANLTGLIRFAAGFGQGDLVEVYDSLGGTARQWVATFEAGKSGYLNGLELAVADVGANPARLEITVLKPPVSQGDAMVENIADWQILGTFNETTAALGISAGQGSQFRMWFANALRVTKGDRLAFVVRMYTAADAPVTFGMGNGRLQAGTAAFFRGNFAIAIGDTFTEGGPSAGYFIYGRPLIRLARTEPKARGQVAVAARKEAGGLHGVPFTRVAFNTLATTAYRYDGLVAKIANLVGVSSFEVLAVRRPGTVRGTSYDTSSYVIGSQPDDEIMFRTRIAASDLFQGRFGILTQTVTFAFPFPVEVNAGELLLVQISALAADRINLGTFQVWANSDFVPISLPIERGSYSVATSGAAMSAIGDEMLTFKLLGEQVERPRVKRLADVPVAAAAIPKTSTTLTLNLPAIAIDAYDNPRSIPAQAITFDGVGAAEVIPAYSETLRYGDITPLRARRHAAVTVVRQSDGVTLIEGTDYYRDPTFGYIRGLQDVPSFAITITEAGYKMRVDTLVWGPFNEAWGILKGTARFSDADNWQREPTETTIGAGRIEICRVLVTNGGLEVLDRTDAVPGAVAFADDDDYLRAIRKHNAPIIRPFLAELTKGAAANITWLMYGDSRTAQGDGIEAEWQTVPGGPTRDRRQFFTLQQPDDCFTNTACPVYTPLIDGPAGAGLHVRASLHWRAIAILNAAYGATITGKNLGIGGTDSSNSGNGTPGSRYGGAHPTRLAGLTAAKGSGRNICFIAFGTNDPDTDGLITNIASICRYCRSNNIIPVVIGQPEVSGAKPIDWHKRQEVRMMRAAMTAGAAFVPLSAIQFDRANRGMLFPSLANGAGGFNHEGLWFDFIAGRWVAEFLLS